MNKIIYNGFEIIKSEVLPENCGLMCTEKQNIMFKIEDGKFQFWEMPVLDFQGWTEKIKDDKLKITFNLLR